MKIIQLVTIVLTLAAVSAKAQTNVIYPYPTTLFGGGNQKFCDGIYHSYSHYVIYTKTIAQGWGWTSNSSVLIAFVGTNIDNTTNIIVYNGEYGDSGCGVKGICVLPYPVYSPAYRFGVYFNDGRTNNFTNCPVTLIGFNP